jgi:hypothetical protein
MKLGPQLLITMLLVAGGIFIYETMRSDSAVGGAAGGYELRPDGVGGSRGPAAGTAQLDGGGETLLAEQNAGRLERLERRLATLQEELARLRRAPRGAAAAGGTGVPAMDPRDIVNADDPRFDDGTLATIAAYFDEINRRKTVERERLRIGTELDRKGIMLSETQKTAIVEQTMAYQDRAREALTSSGYPRDEAGRLERQQAFEALQAEYEATIRRLVPDEEKAGKILESRIARRVGFFGRMPGTGGDGNAARR